MVRPFLTYVPGWERIIGKMLELIHEGDTLSSLLAEQEAVEGARKRYKYVDVVSAKSM